MPVSRLISQLISQLIWVTMMLVMSVGIYRTAQSANGNDIGVDPVSVYGDKIDYSIIRNGKKIGQHTIEFTQQDKALKVSVASSLTVTVLKIPVYRFRYTSDEIWYDGQLQNVIASTTEKGKTSTVSMQRLDDTMVLQNARGEVTRERVKYSSNHWNPGVLSADRLFNTLTAKPNRIDIQKLGTESLIVDGQAIEATQYRYTGELRVNVWYDQQSRWVKLAFEGSDGSSIEYLSNGFDIDK